MFPFEPVELALSSVQKPGAVHRAVFATNLSGSRRVATGARTTCGDRAINGRGEAFIRRGACSRMSRVRCCAGERRSWGTLAVMTRSPQGRTRPEAPRHRYLRLTSSFRGGDGQRWHAFRGERRRAPPKACKPAQDKRAAHLQQAVTAHGSKPRELVDYAAASSARDLRPTPDNRLAMTYRTASERTRASSVVEVDDGPMAHFDEAGGRPKLLMHQRTMQSSVYDWSVGEWLKVPSRPMPGPRYSQGRRCVWRPRYPHPRRSGVRARLRVPAARSRTDQLTPKIKAAFDPAGLLNPGRIYSESEGLGSRTKQCRRISPTSNSGPAHRRGRQEPAPLLHCGLCTAAAPLTSCVAMTGSPRGPHLYVKNSSSAAQRQPGGRGHVDRCLPALLPDDCRAVVDYMHLDDRPACTSRNRPTLAEGAPSAPLAGTVLP